MSDKLKNIALSKTQDSKYIERLNLEFSEIEKAGLWSYFEELIDSKRKFHNDKNLLCAYLWGICYENPIEENKDLIWEVSNEYPDIDVDFEPEARNKIKEYCIKEFGENNVVSIVNYNHFGIKSGIRDIARVLEIPIEEVGFTTTLEDVDISDGSGSDDSKKITWEDIVSQYAELKEFENKYPQACQLVREFNGRIRGMGKHAGGLVISSVDLTKTVPLVTREDPETGKKFVLSSFAEGQNRSDLKTVGLVKQDILGLETLNYISTCLKIMEKRGKYDRKKGLFKISSNEEEWTDEKYLNDPESIKTADRGDLKLIFQFDSGGIRNLVKQGGVSKFEDLATYSSLFRPGPLNSGMATKYVLRKKGKEGYTTHPALEPVIGNTYGVIIYQEQLMQIMNKIGLISLQNCDDIRRAMGKKKLKDLMKYKEIFLENGQRTLGWKKNANKVKNPKFGQDDSESEFIIQDNEDSVEGLWEQMVTFANYGFNRSHAVGYAILSARELYLKTHYPQEYFCAVLNHLKTGDKRIKEYIQEGRNKGIDFESLNINKSKCGFEIIDDKIVIGFDKVKGISKEAVKLIELQPYNSIDDYIERYGSGKKVGEVLIKTGAFKELEDNMAILLKFLEYHRENQKTERGMNKIEFSKMYKELTESKSCPKTISEQFADLLGENKKASYDKLLEFINNDKFEFTLISKDKILEYVESRKKDFENKLMNLEEFKKQQYVKEIKDFSYKEKSDFENELYSFYFNHPLDNYQRECDINIGNLVDDGIKMAKVEGIIVDIEKRSTKKGNPFFIITLEDDFNKIKVLLWSNQYNTYKELIYNGSAIKIDVQASKFFTWNLTATGEIRRMRTLQEPTEREERDIVNNKEYTDLMDKLIRSNNYAIDDYA